MSILTKLCYNPISGICESYTVDGEISCSELGVGEECATVGSYRIPGPPNQPPAQDGLCYAIQSRGSTEVRWTNVNGQVIQAEIPQNTKVYLCSRTLPVEVNQADLEITDCGRVCNQTHNTVLDMYLSPCNIGIIGQGVCSEGGTPPLPPGSPPPDGPQSVAVSPAELSAAFTWEFDTFVEPVTYRRFTTDTLPTYTLTLTNLSDQFYIKAFNSDSSPYILATNLKDNTQFSNTNSILLAPLESKKISVSFATEQINNQVTNQPQLGFRLEALKLIPTPT